MKSLALILILIGTPQAFAGSGGSFMFGGSADAAPAKPAAPVKITPPSPTRPAIAAPVAPAAAARPLPSADSKTEAAPPCPSCGPAARTGLAKIDPSKIAGQSAPAAVRSPAGTGNACLRNAILQAAKENVRRRYGNRPYSGGMCAQGVRLSLNASGIMNSGGMGDAVGWHLAGTLKSKGFVNIMNQGFTAANAPPGAVLIFRGPATNMSSPTGGLPGRRYRRGQSAGNWVGHVTVKGEVPGRYYTDGRTEAPAVARRTLVAVYVPVTCKNCRGAAAKCEAE